MVERIAHYRILRKLGEGGMGEVYLAEDTRLDRRVALKILPERLASDADWLERFRREARAVAGLNHPNIVTLYSIDQEQEVHYFTMELVEGPTLAQTIARKPLPRAQFFQLAESLADALAAAHAKGITHRDLKPANIMIGGDGRAKILDFGLAKVRPVDEDLAVSQAATELLTRVGTVVGTLSYMSPEQLQGREADHRSDIFALGIILCQMATGHHPFPGATGADRSAAVLRDPPVVRTSAEWDLPPAVIEIVRRCLEKKPGARFQSALEVRDRLRELTERPAAPVAVLPPAERSIAILPFKDLSPGGDQEYFCDGIAEEIVDALTAVTGLRVAARSSAFRFRGETEQLKEIGAALGVDSILTGSVRRAGERMRINVQLVDVDSGFHLWSTRFDREERDVFEVQDHIARSVAETLRGELSGASKIQPAAPRAPELDAYHLYLKARHAGGKRTESGLFESLRLFQDTLDRDPAYARAYAGLADSYALLAIYGARPAAEVMPKAKAAAHRALELDEKSAAAQTTLAAIESIFDWAWERGEARFRRALELDPDNAAGYHRYAMDNLVPTARFEAAIEKTRQAVLLDPLSPVIHVSQGLILYFARRYEEAVRELQKLLETEGRFGVAHLFLGRTLSELGRHEEAEVEILRAAELTGGSAENDAALGYAYAVAGRQDEAEEVLARLDERSREAWVSPSMVAQIHAGLDRRERALSLLDQARQERASDLAWAGVRPVFDRLHEEVEFKRLLGEIGLRPRFFK